MGGCGLRRETRFLGTRDATLRRQENRVRLYAVDPLVKNRRTVFGDNSLRNAGEAAVSFTDVGSNRQRGSVQLVDQESVTTGKRFSSQPNLIGEVDSLLIDNQRIEGERHR
jgi:hypothetical protein